MITIEFNKDTKIIHATAKGKISKDDIEVIAKPIIEEIFSNNSNVKGSVVMARELEGWENLEAMTTHFSLLKQYDSKLPKIALISNSIVQEALANFAPAMVKSDVQHFEDEVKAQAWINN